MPTVAEMMVEALVRVGVTVLGNASNITELIESNLR